MNVIEDHEGKSGKVQREVAHSGNRRRGTTMSLLRDGLRSDRFPKGLHNNGRGRCRESSVLKISLTPPLLIVRKRGVVFSGS